MAAGVGWLEVLSVELIGNLGLNDGLLFGVVKDSSKESPKSRSRSSSSNILKTDTSLNFNSNLTYIYFTCFTFTFIAACFNK